MLTKLSKENFEQEVLQSKEKVLVDFYADWCTPCQMLMPKVEEFAEENPNQKVFKVNIDDDMELAQQYGILTIPTLMIFENGEPIRKEVNPQTKERVAALVNE